MLLFYALARPIVSNLSPASAKNSTSFDPITGECIDINGCRTTTGIIWSCLSVIFICTWVAIHPNIPLVEVFDWREKKWTGHHWHPTARIYNNVELLVIALLAPEFMILWAMRQREHAKKIRDKFKEKYGWGMSHGFFVIMGGLALYDGDKFCGYLWDRGPNRGGQLYDLNAEQKFDVIKNYHEEHRKHCLKETETQDPKTLQSSDDHSLDRNPLQKDLLCGPSDPQTLLEFLIANGYITLTEDEIMDRSHADIIAKSIAIFQTTWFIIQVIAHAVEGLAITELEIITVGFALLNFGTYFLWWNKPLRVMHPVRVYWKQKDKPMGGDKGGGVAGDKGGREGGLWRVFWEGTGVIIRDVPLSDNKIVRLLLVPLWILLHVFILCQNIVWDEDDIYLPILISSRLANTPLHFYIIVYGIATLFGGIHCIAWVFHFPTHTEQLLWCISAVAVVAAPAVMGALHAYGERLADSAPRWLHNLMITFLYILSPAYVVFRITLIVIALTALRDLPQSALQTVQWTTFIPHIG